MTKPFATPSAPPTIGPRLLSSTTGKKHAWRLSTLPARSCAEMLETCVCMLAHAPSLLHPRHVARARAALTTIIQARRREKCVG